MGFLVPLIGSVVQNLLPLIFKAERKFPERKAGGKKLAWVADEALDLFEKFSNGGVETPDLIRFTTGLLVDVLNQRGELAGDSAPVGRYKIKGRLSAGAFGPQGFVIEDGWLEMERA